jgi:translation initiation factor IF-1
MKKIGLALVLAAFLFPVSWGRAVELSIPQSGKVTKMTGTVKKVEVEKMYLTFLADKEKKNYRVRGARSVLESLKPGDRIVVSISDNSIKYIRKIETADKGKNKSASSRKPTSASKNPPSGTQ